MSSRDIYTLDDFDLRDKRVLLRVDINSPIDPTTDRILDDTRMRAVLPTINDLKGTKLIITGHQSKPGKSEFTSLKKNAEKMSCLIGQ